jgi:hypothetical protein
MLSLASPGQGKFLQHAAALYQSKSRHALRENGQAHGASTASFWRGVSHPAAGKNHPVPGFTISVHGALHVNCSAFVVFQAGVHGGLVQFLFAFIFARGNGFLLVVRRSGFFLLAGGTTCGFITRVVLLPIRRGAKALRGIGREK